jgi:hypothetical protein
MLLRMLVGTLLALGTLPVSTTSPDTCTMRIVDQAGLMDEALVDQLSRSTTPVIVRNAWHGASLVSLIAEFPDFPLNVLRGHRITGFFTEPDSVVALAEFSQAIRNGSVASDSYVFTPLGDSPLAARFSELGDLFSRVACRRDRPSRSALPRCIELSRGHETILFGANGSGNAFHMHGSALNGLIHGSKRCGCASPRETGGGRGTSGIACSTPAILCGCPADWSTRPSISVSK